MVDFSRGMVPQGESWPELVCGYYGLLPVRDPHKLVTITLDGQRQRWWSMDPFPLTKKVDSQPC